MSKITNIQEKFNNNLLILIEYVDKKQFERANYLLDQFYHENIEFDEQDWLEKSYWNFKAYISEHENNIPKALDIYRNLEKKGILNRFDWITNKLFIASMLEKMNQLEQAKEELEKGLEQESDKTVPALFSLLIKYAELSKKQGIEMPERLRPIIDKVIKWWEFPISGSFFTKSPLADIIEIMVKLSKESQNRILQMRQQLAGIGSPKIEEKKKILKNFVETEKVGFYKKAILKELESL